MKMEKLIELYIKERSYQKKCFGNYKNISSLNIASFLQFIEDYLERAKKSYSGQWQKNLPEWLDGSTEMKNGSCPIEVYSNLIKLFTLAGAALETYAEIDPDKWRQNADEDSQKWLE